MPARFHPRCSNRARISFRCKSCKQGTTTRLRMLVMGQGHDLIRNPKAPDMKLALVQVLLCKHHLRELTGLIVDHVKPYTVSFLGYKQL